MSYSALPEVWEHGGFGDMARYDDSDWVGRVIANRYLIVTTLGAGASARVFRAETTHASSSLPKGAEVALKVSRPHILRKQRDSARFLREVKAIGRIDHRGCIDIHEWGIADGCAYIAMELLEGEDLSDMLMREAPLSATRSVAIVLELCNVLIAAHAEGVVHRDLKPRNILMLADGEGGEVEPRLKVLDFGLAKLFQQTDDDEETLPNALTRPGSVLGSPHYMAPEQVQVEGVIDGRADVYAASVILYEMLTGRRPYKAKNAVRLLVLRSTSDPDPPSTHRPDLDPELEGIVMRGLQRDPKDRYESATAFQRALAKVFPGIEEQERRSGAKPPRSHHEVDLDIDSAERSAAGVAPSSVTSDTMDEGMESVETVTRIRHHPPSVSVGDHEEDEPATTIYDAERLGDGAPDVASLPPKPPMSGDPKQLVYYALTVLVFGAAVARLLGAW